VRRLTFLIGLALLTTQQPQLVISVGLPGPPTHVEFIDNTLATTSRSMLSVVDLTSGLTIVREPQGSLVLALSVSPKGNVLAVGTCGHKLRLRDAATLALLRDIELSQECAETVSFSPDGALIATGAYGCGPAGNGLQVWEVERGALSRQLGPGLGIRRAVFGGDGKWVAGVDDQDRAHVFEWPSGRKLWTLQGASHAGYSGSELFASRDGRYLGWKGDGLRVWDIATGTPLALPGAREYEVHDRPPDGPERRFKESRIPAAAAQFIDDGRLAYVDEPTVHLRTLPAGPDEVLRLPDNEVEFTGDVGIIRPHEWLRISRDARLVVGSRESQTVAWDMTGRQWAKLGGPSLGLPRAVRWSRSGMITWGNLGGEARAWDALGGNLQSLGDEAGTGTLAVPNRDGSLIALSGFMGLSVVDARSSRVLSRKVLRPPAETAAAFSPEGSRIAFAEPDHGLVIYDTDFSIQRRIASLGSLERLEEVAFSPDGRWLAAGIGGREPSFRVWSTETNETATLDKQSLTYGTQPPAFSADSRLLATFRQGKSVVIWSTGSWNAALTLPLTSSGRSLAFAPTGSRLIVASDAETAIWDSATGRKLVTLHAPGIGERRSVAWSPEGRTIVSAADDGALRFWDAATGNLVASLYVPESSTDWLLLTPDGRLDGSAAALHNYVAWRADGLVRLDDAQTRARVTKGLWRAAVLSR
jgi:WD40 repeat protein